MIPDRCKICGALKFDDPHKCLDHSDELYPVTIIKDRYAGSYSGAVWLAFNLYETEIPDGPSDGDSECMNFWNEDHMIGRGDTPDSAFNDLWIRYLKNREDDALIAMANEVKDEPERDFFEAMKDSHEKV